jgi:hypothetical protein
MGVCANIIFANVGDHQWLPVARLLFGVSVHFLSKWDYLNPEAKEQLRRHKGRIIQGSEWKKSTLTLYSLTNPKKSIGPNFPPAP